MDAKLISLLSRAAAKLPQNATAQQIEKTVREEIKKCPLPSGQHVAPKNAQESH
jgi:hypothetical protein